MRRLQLDDTNMRAASHEQAPMNTHLHGLGWSSFLRNAFLNMAALKWFKAMLEGRFDIKSQLLGLNAGEEREAKILNRIVRVDAEGWHYEADQRHAELIIEALDLQKANPCSTPGEDERVVEEINVTEECDIQCAGRFRAIVARANYLAQDRSESQFPV